MTVGTKSLLFGVHQFIWHPLTVATAFKKLYRRWPRWWEWVGIIVHDWGYWGMPNMDGKEGRTHPLGGAKIASDIVYRICRLRGDPTHRCRNMANGIYGWTIGHSREYAKLHGFDPSPLCWADKYCVWHDPKWLYLLRGHLSGELYEFRALAVGAIPDSFTLREWLMWYRKKVYFLPEIQSILKKS